MEKKLVVHNQNKETSKVKFFKGPKYCHNPTKEMKRKTQNSDKLNPNLVKLHQVNLHLNTKKKWLKCKN